jgi:hypothetical protein
MPRPGPRGTSVLALIATLALMVGLTAGPAAGSPSGGSGTAEAAAKKKKKKCKKGQKKVKKKNGKSKCVKKKKKQQPPAPLVRATITWSNADADDADLDLVVFDAAGNMARSGTSAIPSTTISPDVSGKNGSETFTDLSPKPLRNFSFAVCYVVGGSAHAPFTLEYVTADGQKRTVNEDPGSSFFYEYPDGPTIPNGFCAV